MPYRINSKGEKALETGEAKSLTENQQKVLNELNGAGEQREYVDAGEIATDLRMHPQAARGVLHSLYKKGLVDKAN